MYIKFNNISDAREVSKQAYKLFTNKTGVSTYLYHTFECLKGFGWLEIPTGELIMKHNKKSNFNYVFDTLTPILDPIFKTPLKDIKPQMIDQYTYDINEVFLSNTNAVDRQYLIDNEHIENDNNI